MSVGQVGDDAASESDTVEFADALADDEEVLLSWSATDVHWADEWRSVPEETTFAATDRRIVFADGDSTTAIGYEHVRAVMTDPPDDAVALATAFLGSGALSLVVGLLVATVDLLNGIGLVALSVALLVAGGAIRSSSDDVATITIVIDNERQRLSFAAEESVGTQLVDFADAS